MTVEIYHNPRCSKSCAALDLLKGRGIEPRVRLYLEDSPDADELRALSRRLGLRPAELLRKNEEIYRELVRRHGPPDDDTALRWMAEHPILIERPIVIAGERARVGRPPEAVLEILGETRGD